MLRMYEKLWQFLDKNKNKVFTYKEIADKLGTHHRAIGACMKTVSKKTNGKYDNNVVFAKKTNAKKTTAKKNAVKKSVKKAK